MSYAMNSSISFDKYVQSDDRYWYNYPCPSDIPLVNDTMFFGRDVLPTCTNDDNYDRWFNNFKRNCSERALQKSCKMLVLNGDGKVVELDATELLKAKPVYYVNGSFTLERSSRQVDTSSRSSSPPRSSYRSRSASVSSCEDSGDACDSWEPREQFQRTTGQREQQTNAPGQTNQTNVPGQKNAPGQKKWRTNAPGGKKPQQKQNQVQQKQIQVQKTKHNAPGAKQKLVSSVIRNLLVKLSKRKLLAPKMKCVRDRTDVIQIRGRHKNFLKYLEEFVMQSAEFGFLEIVSVQPSHSNKKKKKGSKGGRRVINMAFLHLKCKPGCIDKVEDLYEKIMRKSGEPVVVKDKKTGNWRPRFLTRPTVEVDTDKKKTADELEKRFFLDTKKVAYLECHPHKFFQLWTTNLGVESCMKNCDATEYKKVFDCIFNSVEYQNFQRVN